MGWLQHPGLLHTVPTQPLHTTTVVRQGSTENVVLNILEAIRDQSFIMGKAMAVCD